jgi:hypothetical protein
MARQSFTTNKRQLSPDPYAATRAGMTLLAPTRLKTVIDNHNQVAG